MKLTQPASEICDRISFIHMWMMGGMNDRARTSQSVSCPENDEFDTLSSKLVGESMLCKLVDLYQVYNRRVLKLVIDADPNVLEMLRFKIPISAVELSTMIKGAVNLSSILDKIQFNDLTVRESIHKHLKIWKESEMDFLIEARNCFVHADGYGFDADLRAKMQPGSSPWKLPFTFSEHDRLEVDEATAFSICSIELAQISIMDQILVNSFGLASSEHVSKSYTRKMLG